MSKRIKEINNFIVDNSELDALTDKLEQFNIFDVLGVTHYEIRHSNSMAWFFDSQGHHGYSDKFFRRFISRALHESENNHTNCNPGDVELSQFTDLQVFREWKNIDLLLVSDSNKIVVIIENKVHARESKGQLKKYLLSVQEHWPKYTIIPLFLTLEGDDPSEEGLELGYIPVSFVMVLDLISSLQQRHYSGQSDEARGFIDNYIQIIMRLTMQDEELSNLCKSIYRKHKKAIDLIVSYGGSSQVYEACKAALEESGHFELTESKPFSFIQETRGRVFFVPKVMGENMKEVELSRWQHIERQFPICCWFKRNAKTDKLQITIEIGPVENFDLRQKLVEVFDTEEFSVRKKAYVEGTYYTRVYSKNISIASELESDNNLDELKNVAVKLFSGMMKKLTPRLNALNECFK
jgi:hypothetical protein